MMEIKYIALDCLMAAALLGTAACSSDETTESPDGIEIETELRLSSRQAAESRAAWEDANAVDGEMMRNWFVVIVQNGQIQSIVTNETYGAGVTEKEEDRALVKLETGQTTFYSFANIQPSDLGLDAGATFPVALPSGFDQKIRSVSGNKNDVGEFTDGIPMSNKQTISITKDTREVDLEVVRMVAKVRLQFYNESGHELTINSVGLSDITPDGANYLLLPNFVGDSVGTNLAASATKSDYTWTLPQPVTIADQNEEPGVVTFYVNESEASAPRYFVLTVNTDETISRRFAMLNWNSISRNDYLVIPVIKLTDYYIDCDVEAFTAVGVLPEVTKQDGQLTATFDGYGEFHIRPTVKKISDGTVLGYGTGGWEYNGFETLESNPSGAAGTCIYDELPTWIQSSRVIEGYIGGCQGYALHRLNVKLNGSDFPLTYKLEIKNIYKAE